MKEGGGVGRESDSSSCRARSLPTRSELSRQTKSPKKLAAIATEIPRRMGRTRPGTLGASGITWARGLRAAGAGPSPRACSTIVRTRSRIGAVGNEAGADLAGGLLQDGLELQLVDEVLEQSEGATGRCGIHWNLAR